MANMNSVPVTVTISSSANDVESCGSALDIIQIPSTHIQLPTSQVELWDEGTHQGLSLPVMCFLVQRVS